LTGSFGLSGVDEEVGVDEDHLRCSSFRASGRADGCLVRLRLAWRGWSSWLFCVPPRRAGHLVPDAHLAALAIEHGCAIYSTDHDFGRFAGVEHVNPLTS
jgi:predicted nucleic acid-binding protein